MNIHIDKKFLTIGLLSFSAVVLVAANLLVPQRAAAELTIKERDYSAVTAHVATGGDALYVTDNRTGMMGVFLWNPNQKALTLSDIKPVSDAFRGAGMRH